MCVRENFQGEGLLFCGHLRAERGITNSTTTKKTTLPKLLLSSGQIHQKVPTVFNEMHVQISQFRLDIRAELGDSGNIVILRVR